MPAKDITARLLGADDAGTPAEQELS
jgi:hypothetical protein